MSDRRLRILFFISSLSAGGVERQVLRLLERLDRGRFEPRLAVARLAGPLIGDVPADVPVTRLSPSWIRYGSVAVLTSVPPLRRLIDEWQPHLLYSAKPHVNVAALRAREGANPRPKAIIRLTNALGPHPHRRRTLFRRFVQASIRASYPKSDAIICISQGIRRDLEAICPSAAGKAVVIHNIGLDESTEAKSAEPIDEKICPSPLVIACGRLTPQKGFDLLIPAFAEVRRHVPAHLWILGEGTDRGALQALIDRLDLSASVRLLGFRSNPYPYFARAQAFVLSSRWEGFGNVLVEAMACGAPVLATRCTWGPDEIVSHGTSGLLCEPDSVDALAQGILTLLRDRDLASRLSSAGRARARDYSPDVIVPQHEELFIRTAGVRTS